MKTVSSWKKRFVLFGIPTNMKIIPLNVGGAYLIECDRYKDNRGFFQELYHDNKYPDGIQNCAQVSFSESGKNVFRGIHCSQYNKIVMCMRGRILDICIDLIETSPTYLQYCTVILDENKSQQVNIPPGCGHAYFTLEDHSYIIYIQGGTFNEVDEMDVNYKDPKINLQIHELQQNQIIISDKDNNAPMLDEARKKWNERHSILRNVEKK
ncbi:unnamed protein product [Didymodactylos carnosus]|uniref:dTDP-4-dehydrorhamnose 3,5-epimerase n=1 Tax=Didymodactylos carnosus TaxID=1234261 RepID=A0A814ZJ37_9BILA|nr:unnamed protein product [Didymodactylos carnosus]CAF4008244.1 unnamed protein product [Didymodactylos carnosus]